VLPRLVDWVPAEQRGGSGPAGIHRTGRPASASVSGFADWKTRVDKLFRDHGDAPSRRALAAAPPFSYERLALMIGRAHETDLPWALQVRLPGAFAESMGKWSRKELTRQGA
jgi:hypothetical protein